MMTDQGAKLEQYVILAKSARGESAAKLILNAISTPGVYVFSELLEQPSVQDLANTSHAGHLALLQLFSYGTLADYNANPSGFPPIEASQLLKLKHLTLVSLALRNRSIPYQAISQALQVESTRELEDLIIDVMYAGLLGGKMHHDEKILHVDWVSGRDVSPESLVDIGNALRNWSQTSQTLLAALDEQITYLRKQTASEKSDREQYTSARNNAFIRASKVDPKKSRWAGEGNDETYGHGPPPGYEHPAFDPLQLQQAINSGENPGRLGVGRGHGSSQSTEGDDMRMSKRMKSDEMEE